ncbi:heparan-alpha-glucosaminide N-acetyltransferase domain-containing protein [Rhodococcus sp. NPDC058505]|uniref:heparan-alpha-glucosaminide N-acetyltransferase domain-containing protein n=1 Tax=Rhodococcus sp. NPDC058505 TaxID=3346531 RepID=UPI003646B752
MLDTQSFAAAAAQSPPTAGGGGRARIVAVDVARALALIGMIVSHLMPPEGAWGRLFLGFPSALFAVLSGVSLAIMADRGIRSGGDELAGSRHALMVRGVLLIALQQLVAPVSGTIFVVLQTIGICYIALACAPRWRTRTLAVLAAWLVAASAVLHAVASVTALPVPLLPPYPVTVWAALTVAGILTYRQLLGSTAAQVWTLVVGAAIAIAGAALRNGAIDYEATRAARDRNGLIGVALVDPAPHSGGLLDTVTVAAGALAALALCLLVCRGPVSWTRPLQAMGSMSLTVYVAHLVSAGPFSTPSAPASLPVLGWTTIVAALAGSTLLSLWFRQGPCEWVMARCCARAADRTLPPRPALARG